MGRLEHLHNRQTRQAITTIGSVSAALWRNRIDTTPFFAALQRACREAEKQMDERAA